MSTEFQHGVSSRGADIGAGLPYATGKYIYVDGTNGSDGNLGEHPDEALASIGQAITKSTSTVGDVVVIAPGTYTITAALVPLANTTFIAARRSNKRVPTVSITSIGSHDFLQLEVDDVKFIGIEFLGGHADNAVMVDISETANADGCSFVDCVFNGGDFASLIAINADDGTYFPTGLEIIGCLFRDLTGTMLEVGVLGIPYAYIAYNHFAIDIAAGTAINLDDTSAFATGKGYVIEFNTFTGVDATKDEVGITIAGTEDTTGAGIIRRNDFAYLHTAPITIDKVGFSCIQNYYGDDTGGLLVDVGT